MAALGEARPSTFPDLRGRVVTRARLVIGGRYVPPAPRPSVDADAFDLQTALLAPRRRAGAWVRTLAAGLAALSIARGTR